MSAQCRRSKVVGAWAGAFPRAVAGAAGAGGIRSAASGAGSRATAVLESSTPGPERPSFFSTHLPQEPGLLHGAFAGAFDSACLQQDLVFAGGSGATVPE
jgi:hypothetical protein